MEDSELVASPERLAQGWSIPKTSEQKPISFAKQQKSHSLFSFEAPQNCSSDDVKLGKRPLETSIKEPKPQKMASFSSKFAGLGKTKPEEKKAPAPSIESTQKLKRVDINIKMEEKPKPARSLQKIILRDGDPIFREQRHSRLRDEVRGKRDCKDPQECLQEAV
jgi:hypothetical protein